MNMAEKPFLGGWGSRRLKNIRTNFLKRCLMHMIFKRIFAGKFTLVGSAIKNATQLPEPT
jgi:hypothetical protein